MKTKVYFGGWYQRTTLHLSEVYALMAYGKSDLALDKNRLEKYREGLGLKKVSREAGYLEYVLGITNEGIEIRYYEDGLYVFERETEDIKKTETELREYYENKFAPAVAYIFSLGAPTPKVLANIKTEHPVSVGITTTDVDKFKVASSYGEVYSEVKSGEKRVLKTDKYIFILSKGGDIESLDGLVEMQIFFREFKDQLQKYLNIHRGLWEKISEIKERKMIRGSEVDKIRIELEDYQKTINLINSRISQMGAYVHTRAQVAREMGVEEHLGKLFQYKFEVLTNSHSYIRDIWTMTQNYLSSALAVVTEVRNLAVNKSIQSLQVITTYGVVAGIMGFLARDSWPKVTGYGLGYFVGLVVVTMLINRGIAWAYLQTKYKLSFGENTKKL